MAQIPQVFKVSDLPASSGGGLSKLPIGNYQVIFTASEFKPTKANDGSLMLVLTGHITQGPYAGTEFVERLNLVNKSDKAQAIAYKTLARISEAVGMTTTPSDSVQLHNKPLIIELVTEAGEMKEGQMDPNVKWPDKSIIGKYHPLPAVGGFGQPAFVAQAVASVPAAANQGAATNVVTPPANAPWAK